jgi:hypothetical protein
LSRTVTHLREEKTAAIADFWIEDAELMAVIAQRQRLREIVGQRLETGEMAQPLGVAQPAEAHRCRPALVAEAELLTREIRRSDGIGQPGSEGQDSGIGPVGSSLRFGAHPAIVGAGARFGKARTSSGAP